jgi:hypothetical protein
MNKPEKDKDGFCVFWVEAVWDSRKKMDEEDAEVPGFFKVTVKNPDDSDIPEAQWAGAAMDVFHNTVAISVLDEFVFDVYLDAEKQHLIQEDTDEYEPYSIRFLGGASQEVHYPNGKAPKTR